jgi:hypothetical protein
MQEFLSWLRSKSITSHTIAVAAIAAATLITTDQQLRDFVLELFKAHPVIGTDIIALAGIILKYSHSSSPAGTVATATAILASPERPTAGEVLAATVKPLDAEPVIHPELEPAVTVTQQRAQFWPTEAPAVPDVARSIEIVTQAAVKAAEASIRASIINAANKAADDAVRSFNVGAEYSAKGKTETLVFDNPAAIPEKTAKE